MNLIKKFIYEKVASKELSQADAKELLQQLAEKPGQQKTDDVAIIGMACKFPKAKNVDEFWENLRAGRNCIGEFPTERAKDFWHVLKNPHYAELLIGKEVPYKKLEDIEFVKGAYLDEIDKFDAGFFGIPPREATYMSPQQRLVLETAWEAIEDAGYGGEKVHGTRTGVFIGKENTNYQWYRFVTVEDGMHLTGSWESIIASRISYLLNLQGPSMVVDTACSAGLVSVHMAIQALNNKECDMALAGGINTIELAELANCKSIMDLSSVESKTSTVKTFDKEANGTVWGEGVGVVMLKPLKKAIEDGDNIHAVIKASAINNDGASNGLTAPSAEAQEEIIVRTWKEAEINPETVSYIEAHGTGTVLGDPIEYKGLTNSFRRFTQKNQFCAIGSLKTNMGHLVATSGVASLLKVVLSLKHKELTPTINFENPNPYINFGQSPLYVNDTLKKWETDGVPRRAGVSSFGFSGTNCHVLLEEFDRLEHRNENSTVKKAYILTISAKNEEALKRYLLQYNRFLLTKKAGNYANICHTSNMGRGHYSHRLAMVVESNEDLKQKMTKVLSESLNNLQEKDIYYRFHKVVSDSKTLKGNGEITVKEKNQKNEQVNLKQSCLRENNDKFAECLGDIAQLYVEGADVSWDVFYSKEARNKISLPCYPLERIRFWADPKVSKVNDASFHNGFGNPVRHPLFDHVVESVHETIYVSQFNTEQWVLSDHKVMDNHVIPGTTYIEMAREAACAAYPDSFLEFRDVFFLTPLLVAKDEVKEIHTIIRKENDYLCFSIAGKDETNEDIRWVKHFEGNVHVLHNKRPEAINLKAIRQQCPDYQEVSEFISKTNVFEFGPRWDCPRNAYYGKNEVLIELSLRKEIQSDLENFQLHPSVLDSAVNVLSQSIGEGTYLPLSYKSFKFYKRMEATVYSHVKAKINPDSNLEVIPFDITLSDAEGNVLAEITDYCIKKVHKSELSFSARQRNRNTYFEMGWKAVGQPEAFATSTDGLILVLKDNAGLSNELIASFRKSGTKVIEAGFGDAYEKTGDGTYILSGKGNDYLALFEDLKEKSFSRIIHCGSITGEKAVDSVKGFEEEEAKGVYSLFHLIRALIAKKVKVEKEIILIADSVHEITGKEKTINPFGASLFGLGKVATQEYSNIKCVALDIDSGVTPAALLAEIRNAGKAGVTALRGKEVFIQEMKEVKLEANYSPSFEVKDEGVYIITGGTGGLGLAMAQMLSSAKRKVKLALVNRSKFPEPSQWDVILQTDKENPLIHKIIKLKQIKETGAEINCYPADISHPEEARNLITSLKTKYGKINGIIHAAGVAGKGFFLNKPEDVFRKVLLPKTLGTWMLHRLTADQQLDFFVLFSSITALTGGPGQGDYTAANAFLDSFSSRSRKNGEKVISINWPAWRETGMAVDFNVKDDFLLFKSISTRDAFNALETLIEANRSNIVPAELNPDIASEAEEDLIFKLSDSIKNLIKRYKKKASPPFDSNHHEPASKGIITLKGKSEDEITQTERILSHIWSSVLGISEIDLFDSFQEMGGDSILATHLLKAVEKEFPGTIDISDIYSYPNVISMAEYINKRTQKQASAASAFSDEDQLKSLLDSLTQDDVTVENALDVLTRSNKL